MITATMPMESGKEMMQQMPMPMHPITRTLDGQTEKMEQRMEWG